MSNWGFESPEEWSKLLKLDNFLYIHAKKWKIGNYPWCVLTPISQLLFGQNWKSRTVLKSSGRADFKTDLPFWIWWRFDGDIDKKQTGEFFCGHPVFCPQRILLAHIHEKLVFWDKLDPPKRDKEIFGQSWTYQNHWINKLYFTFRWFSSWTVGC